MNFVRRVSGVPASHGPAAGVSISVRRALIAAGLLVAAGMPFLDGPALPGTGVVPALAADGPIIRMEGRSEMEIDLHTVVNDFLPLLAGVEEDGSKAWSAQVDALVDLIGIRALDRMTVRSYVSSRKCGSQVTITLDPGADGFLPRLAAVPPGRFRFGRYLDPEGTVMVASLQNFSEGLKTLAGLVADAGLPNLPLTRTAGGHIMAAGVDLDRDVFPHLEGELDFILFPMDGEEARKEPSLAVVVGTPDGPALWDHLLQIAAAMTGEENIAPLRDDPGERAGEFTFHSMGGDVATGVGPNFVIVTTDPRRVMEVVTRTGRGIEAPAGRHYVRVDGDRMLELAATMMETRGEDASDQILADVLRRVGEEPIGVVEILTSSRAGRIDTEIRQPPSLITLEYRLLREMAAHAAAIRETAGEKGHYRDIVAELDDALTRYGKEHDGVFPEDPEDLVSGGYLEVFPDIAPTPLGTYMDDGYTYITLRDDAGTVVGYFLFVYGGGEHTGYDVLTPDNVAHPEAFQVASDGERDGVASFCYDGTAIDQVDAWRGN